MNLSPREKDKLLISMDQLAALAGFDEERLTQLQEMVHSDDETLRSLWANVGRVAQEVREAVEQPKPPREVDQVLEEKWLVVIECDGEAHQRDVLQWAKQQGMKARAVIS